MKFKRKLKRKTDYRQRLSLLKSRKTRLVIRKASNNIRVQFVDFKNGHDRTVLEMTSKSLDKFGWNGHKTNTPCAYLLGLLAGIRASEKGIQHAVLDAGLNRTLRNSVIFAVGAGAVDGGVKIPTGIKFNQDRISGKHIAAYAEKMYKENKEKYDRHFSIYLKKGIDPKKISNHFEEVRKTVLGTKHSLDSVKGRGKNE